MADSRGRMNDLEAMRMFAAVLEAGSFTAAAARLGVSSGQASKLVSRLEAQLGVQLLNRTTRSLAPTEAGQAYLDRLRPLLDEFDDLDLAVRSIAGAPRGRLRLTAPLSFGVRELTPALNDFAVGFPHISLDVSFSDRLVNLIDEGFDLAIRVGRAEDSSLFGRKLGHTRIVTIAAPAYLALNGRPQTPEALVGHPCIIDGNYRDPNRWVFSFEGTERAVPVAGRVRFSNAEACLQAAEAGLGIARMPDFVARESLALGRVERLLDAFDVAPHPIHALYPHNRHLATKVRALVDFLAERLRSRD